MNPINRCYECEHKRDIPGDCHISCVNPDPNMTGLEHGIRNGWFRYPHNFDPTWANRKCDNFKTTNKGEQK
jgi:hypothetical protein